MSRLILVAAALAAVPSAALAVLTPEQRAVGGQIPNPSIDEFYAGTLNSGASKKGFISGAVSGVKPSVTWYKFVADGVSPVVFDQFGSNYGFGGGSTFGGGNNGELVLYRPDGTVVGSNESPRAPLRGDSTLRPVAPAGYSIPAASITRQSDDPRLAAGRFQANSNGTYSYFNSNTYNLSQLAFVAHPQSAPLGASGDWDEYGILPAGEYFLAVTGYSTYFAGVTRDADAINEYGETFPNADGPVTSSTPFGIVTFHANDGIYQINARKAGDIDLDDDVDLDDRAALHAKVLGYASTGGLAPESFADGDVANGAWLGLPANVANPDADLARFDLTANHRIDKFDQLQWSRWTGLAASIAGDTDLDDDVDFADLLTLAKNYNKTGDREWSDGDFNFSGSVSFEDLLALAKNYGQGTHNAPSFAVALAQLPASVAGNFGTDAAFVPEPAMLAVAGLCPITLAIRRRRRV